MATIHDVAKLAGVSAVTVSRVLNNSNRVSPATQARVQRAIDDLGYVPSVAARSLRSRQTFTLALIVPDINNTFWTTVARGVEDAAQGKGYSVFLCNSDENPAKQQRYLDVVISQQVDGVIIAPYDANADNLEKLRQRNIPVVVVDRDISGWEVDTVRGDSVAGARALVRHLVGLGHRRIAVITGTSNTTTAIDRVVGYHLALSEAGLEIDPALVRFGEFRSITGERQTDELLGMAEPPTAIFAANNAIAMGVIDSVGRHGLRIPHDIALVCFDDLPHASHLFPFLTVASQPVYDLGVNAAQLLLSRLADAEELPVRQVVLPTRLVVRRSCGSRLLQNGNAALSLPVALGEPETVSIAQRATQQAVMNSRAVLASLGILATRHAAGVEQAPHSDVTRLLATLRHQPAERTPYLEMWIDSPTLYAHLLGRPAQPDRISGRPVTPEDHVELAGRLGMDAVVCDLAWPGSPGQAAAPLLDQLNYLERYLRAVQETGVGVIVHLTGLMVATSENAIELAQLLHANRPLAERRMDESLKHQLRLLRALCDRFADDLTAVLVSERLSGPQGPLVSPDLLEAVYAERARLLIAPAREHGKLVGIHLPGQIGGLVGLLHAIGFDFVHPVDPACNDLAVLRAAWAGKMALAGGFPADLLSSGPVEAIQLHARSLCAEMAAGGGFVPGSAGGIGPETPIQHVVALAAAVQSMP
ncbi:MAG: substrate-binding domain-containing protein [Caldilineales bacterium]